MSFGGTRPETGAAQSVPAKAQAGLKLEDSGLLTPGATPEPEERRIESDKRRQNEPGLGKKSAKSSTKVDKARVKEAAGPSDTSSSTAPPDEARVTEATGPSDTGSGTAPPAVTEAAGSSIGGFGKTPPDKAKVKASAAGPSDTSSSTAPSDEARVKEAAGPSDTSSSTAPPDEARVKEAAGPSDTGSGTAPPSKGKEKEAVDPSDSDSTTFTPAEYQSAIDRIQKYKPEESHKILRVKKSADRKQVNEAFERLEPLLNPLNNKCKGAASAFKRAIEAHNTLNPEEADTPQYDPSAFDSDDNDEADGETDEDAMDVDELTKAGADTYTKAQFSAASPCLETLLDNTSDEMALTKIGTINANIRQNNIRNGRPESTFQIKIQSIIAQFNLAKKYRRAIIEDPTDSIARDKLKNINGVLAEINRENGYPEDWQIHIESLPKGLESSKDAGHKGPQAQRGIIPKPRKKPQEEDGDGDYPVRGGTGAVIPDESNGMTSLGKVLYVRKAGYGSRVIVNRGTDVNPYYEIHPGAAFGKGVAKEWEQSSEFKIQDVPKETTLKQIERITGRVKVKHTRATTRNQLQYYLIKLKASEEIYIITRSALSKQKGMGPASLKRIDNQMDRDGKIRLKDLNACRRDNIHPDLKRQLTEAEVQEMPWLSTDAETENNTKEEEEEEGEEVDVDSLVVRSEGLRKIKQ